MSFFPTDNLQDHVVLDAATESLIEQWQTEHSDDCHISSWYNVARYTESDSVREMFCAVPAIIPDVYAEATAEREDDRIGYTFQFPFDIGEDEPLNVDVFVSVASNLFTEEYNKEWIQHDNEEDLNSEASLDATLYVYGFWVPKFVRMQDSEMPDDNELLSTGALLYDSEAASGAEDTSLSIVSFPDTESFALASQFVAAHLNDANL